jgi:hypothetical protein
MENVTEKMDSVEGGNCIDEALRHGRAMRDALLTEREAFETLSVEQQERALFRAFDVFEVLGDIEMLLRARMLPRQVAHLKATALSRLPGEQSH